MASAPETSSPSPKRVKLTGAKRKTFLFLIARHSSWKATVSLPSMSAFSVGDVKNALKERCLPVPAFPKGKFEVIRADKAFQVAIFKYGRESVVGCRRTASKQHDALPCTRAILLLEREGQDEAEEEQQLQHTPPKAGEVRAALIEGKVSSPQAEEEVTKQLMANLVLLGATSLHRLLLTATGEEVAEFNHFVVYGCQLSPVHSLKLLKLAIDFDEEALTFYELFQLPVCCGLGAYIDMVLDYVFGALKKC